LLVFGVEPQPTRFWRRTRGQRAFVLALGYVGWFAGPYMLIASTAAVVIVLWRR
jgi:uncharacterized membrane protein